MRTPAIYTASQIKAWEELRRSPLGQWQPARPVSYPGLNLTKRIKAAWLALTGKADLITWGDE